MTAPVLAPGEFRIVKEEVGYARCAKCGKVSRRRTGHGEKPTPPIQCPHCHSNFWRTPRKGKSPGTN